MLSKTEMKMLSDISRGNSTVSSLITTEDITRSQIYSVLRSLREKQILHLDQGKITLENKTHIALLMKVLRSSYGSYGALSNNGMDILAELRTPRTVRELSERLGIHQTTVSEKIRELMRLSMIKKDEDRYSINRQLWPDLPELAEAYFSYVKNNDPRATPGSIIYFVSRDLVVFSNDSETGCTKTAFSLYTDFGIKITSATNYYCSLKYDVSLPDVFLHSLYVIAADKNWWLRMMALIFYAKFKEELKGIHHAIKDEMDAVLSGSKVDGWVPLDEMRERAEMYGVIL